MHKFKKDIWIQYAIRCGYLKPQRDGSILRYTKVSTKGELLPGGEYRKVSYQIHKKTGRVFFNMTFMGFTKSVLVNRVIAWAFLPNPQNLPQVNHISGDKENNAVDNLEWSTGSDNERHAHRTGLKTGRGSANANAKLTALEVEQIRASQASVPELMEQFGISRSTIANILSRRTWKHV